MPIRTNYDSQNLTNLSQFTNGPGYVSAYYTSPLDFRGGSHMLHASGTGASVINATTYSAQVGPATSRVTTANSYYGGIAFNHLLNYAGGTLNADSTSYNAAPQAWIGTRLYDTPGSERDYLVFATKPGTGTSGAGTDVPVERMCIDPVNGYVGINTLTPSYYLDVNGQMRVQGNNRTLYGPNTSWTQYLQIGGNGIDGSYAQIATTNGNLHLESLGSGYGIYLNYYRGGPVYARAGAYTVWDSGNLTNLSQLTNGPGYITSGSSFVYKGSITGGSQTEGALTSGWYTVGETGYSAALLHLAGIGGSTPAVQLYFQYNDNMWYRSARDSETQWDGVARYGNLLWSSGNLSNLSQLTNGPGFLGKFGNTYYQADTRIQFTGGSNGIYSATNSAHMYANDASYGSWRIAGTRNGWGGLSFDASNGQVDLMILPTSNHTGFHNPSYGWQFFWSAGTMYIYKNNYGGGTQATNWDSSNLTSVSQLSNGSGFLVDGGTYSSLRRISDNNYGLGVAYNGNSAFFDTVDSGYDGDPLELVYYRGQGVRIGTGGNGSKELRAAYLYASGGPVWTSGGWNSLSNLNQLSNGPGFIGDIRGSSNTWTSYNYFQANSTFATYYNGSGNSFALQAYSTGNYTASMSLHRGGYYAVNFGLDADNLVRIGGWSAAANRWQLDMGGTMYAAAQIYAYNGSPVLSQEGSSYYRVHTWLQIDGSTGLYAPSSGGGTHWYPQTGTYGSWRLEGSTNGWLGVYNYNTSNIWMTAGHYYGGMYSNGYGAWLYYTESRNFYSPGLVMAGWSDGRLKENLRPIGYEALEILSKMTTYRFDWNEKATVLYDYLTPGKEEIGLIAQDVQAALPDAVGVNRASNDPDLPVDSPDQPDYLSINYNKITPILVQAVNQLRLHISEMKEEMDAMKAEITDLKGQLNGKDNK